MSEESDFAFIVECQFFFKGVTMPLTCGEALQSSLEDKDLDCPHRLYSLWGQSSLGTKSLVNIPILLIYLCPMLLSLHLTWFREPFLFFRPVGVSFDCPGAVTNPLYAQSQNTVITLHRKSVHKLACTQSSRLWLPWGQGQLIDSTMLWPPIQIKITTNCCQN